GDRDPKLYCSETCAFGRRLAGLRADRRADVLVAPRSSGVAGAVRGGRPRWEPRARGGRPRVYRALAGMGPVGPDRPPQPLGLAPSGGSPGVASRPPNRTSRMARISSAVGSATANPYASAMLESTKPTW